MLISLIRSGLKPQMVIFMVIIYVFAMTLSFSVHEFMHASTAVWLGDPTPRNMGRLTLNPLAHLDPVGTILLLVAGFGWGKPVMYNPRNLRRFKSYRGMNIMVHLAGVTGNFIVGLISAILAGLFSVLAVKFDPGAVGEQITPFYALYMLFSYTNIISLMLLGFNLLPIPPLDGFHVLEECLPYKVRSSNGYRKFEQFSPYIIWVVFILGYFTNIPGLSTLIGIIEWPFNFIINLLTNPLIMLVAKALGVG